MSAAIPAGMLTAMRTAFNTSLARTCTLKTPGSPTASRGQFTQTESDAATAVKCSFRPATGDERVVGGAQIPVGSYVVTFESGVAIKSEMRAVFNATGDELEKSFSLIAPLDTPQPIGQQWLATSP